MSSNARIAQGAHRRDGRDAVQGRLDGLDAVARLQRRFVFEHTLQGQLDRLAQTRQLLGRCIAHGELFAIEIAASPADQTPNTPATPVDMSGSEGSAP
jgi:hypothetical protein